MDTDGVDGVRPLDKLSFRARFDLDLVVQRNNGVLGIASHSIQVDSTPLRIRGIVGSSIYRSARAALVTPTRRTPSICERNSWVSRNGLDCMRSWVISSQRTNRGSISWKRVQTVVCASCAITTARGAGVSAGTPGVNFDARTRTLTYLWNGVAVIGSLLVSYARSRAETLGVDCKVGIMTRLERVLVTVLMLVLNPLYPDVPVLIGLGLMAVFTHVTVIMRIVHVRREMDRRGI